MMMSNRPTTDMLVMTSDGVDLGKVKEVSGECFKVDAPMAPDYWLANDTISDASAGALRLNFKREDLDEAKVKNGGHSGIHRHT